MESVMEKSMKEAVAVLEKAEALMVKEFRERVGKLNMDAILYKQIDEIIKDSNEKSKGYEYRSIGDNDLYLCIRANVMIYKAKVMEYSQGKVALVRESCFGESHVPYSGDPLSFDDGENSSYHDMYSDIYVLVVL